MFLKISQISSPFFLFFSFFLSFFFSFYLFMFFDKRRCVKSVRIRSYSDPYFHTFRLNTKRYSVSLCISSYLVRMWENKDQKNSEYGTFHAVTAKNIYSRTEADCTSIFAGKSISEIPVSIQLQKQPPQVFC